MMVDLHWLPADFHFQNVGAASPRNPKSSLNFEVGLKINQEKIRVPLYKLLLVGRIIAADADSPHFPHPCSGISASAAHHSNTIFELTSSASRTPSYPVAAPSRHPGTGAYRSRSFIFVPQILSHIFLTLHKPCISLRCIPRSVPWTVGGVNPPQFR